MLNSMTGFTSLAGATETYAWVWDLRGVNGKGLDIRLRLPDWVEGLEAEVRVRLTKALTRGNINASLRLRALSTGGTARIDPAALDAVLSALYDIEAVAMEKGVSLASSRASDILGLRGVFEESGEDSDTTALRQSVLASFDDALADFVGARAAEGKALATLLDDQITQIAALVEQAAAQVEARKPQAEAQFRAALERVNAVETPVDDGRIAQEIALLAVRTDVTEELDRLNTHCEAARTLLATGSPVGRKLDFLAQEFNREANTLCSKSQNTDLTATGLELKSVIEQMREQVQNVE